jgi:uncharacterized membrane protein YesL
LSSSWKFTIKIDQAISFLSSFEVLLKKSINQSLCHPVGRFATKIHQSITFFIFEVLLQKSFNQPPFPQLEVLLRK